MRMSKTIAWRALIVVAGLSSLTASESNAQTALRWKFQPGETLRYALNQTTKIQISINQQSYENSMTQMIDTTWTIKGVTDGKAQIAQTIDRIRTTIVTPSGQIAYDSKEGTEPEGPFAAIAPILRALSGSEIAFTMDPRGEVTEVTLPPKVVETITNMPNAPGGTPSSTEGGAKKSDASNSNPMFSEEGIKKMIAQSTLALPEKTLTPGDQWSSTTAIQTPPVGTMELTHTFVYKGPEGPPEGGVQRIDVAIKTDIKTGESNLGAIDVKDQESSGYYLFDNASGRLDRSNITQKMEMVVKTPNGEITQSNISNSTMTLNP